MSTKNMSKNIRLRGFMCQSPASTAVGCVPADMRAVVVPSKSSGRSMVVDNNDNLHGRIHRNVKYSRLNSKEREFLLPLGDKNLNEGDHHHHHHHHRQQQHHHHQHHRQHHHHQPSAVHQKHQKPKNLQLSSVGSDDEIFQVVVLRVSIHCQGCAGKVKKHLSRMQGVTSFSIDMETKRVTVMGHVSPTEVLESVSKIKRAEFWNC